MQHPVLRKRQQKPPSSEAVAAADLKALVTEYSSRYSSNPKQDCMHKPLQPSVLTISNSARNITFIKCLSLVAKPLCKAKCAAAHIGRSLMQAPAAALHVCRWEVQAVCKGTTDAAAQLQAAKGLAALLSHVQQHHKATCRRAEVRCGPAASSASDLGFS
jgi:hypothetical protein